MHAVILGGRGQLGQELVRQLPGAVALGRADVDLTDAAALRSEIERHRPQVVFNAASNNQVDAAEIDPQMAFRVNAVAVGMLARICRDSGVRLVHFSTNYVFGRNRARRIPYRENELPEPVNAYGV